MQAREAELDASKAEPLSAACQAELDAFKQDASTNINKNVRLGEAAACHVCLLCRFGSRSRAPQPASVRTSHWVRVFPLAPPLPLAVCACVARAWCAPLAPRPRSRPNPAPRPPSPTSANPQRCGASAMPPSSARKLTQRRRARCCCACASTARSCAPPARRAAGRAAAVQPDAQLMPCACWALLCRRRAVACPHISMRAAGAVHAAAGRDGPPPSDCLPPALLLPFLPTAERGVCSGAGCQRRRADRPAPAARLQAGDCSALLRQGQARRRGAGAGLGLRLASLHALRGTARARCSRCRDGAEHCRMR